MKNFNALMDLCDFNNELKLMVCDFKKSDVSIISDALCIR